MIFPVKYWVIFVESGGFPSEPELIKENCADEIADFGKQFKRIHKLYDNLGLYYPEECNTNYRDSWFHYRKLYKKKDEISILNEKYGLEEHLLRSAKDAQICFLQQLGYWLEIWYRYDDFLVCNNARVSEYEKLFQNLNTNWVRSIEEACPDDNELFANACLYYFLHHINSDVVKKNLQILIHSIKNLILDLRLGGVNISRPIDNIDYFRRCVAVFNKMCISLQKSGMLYLISSTGVILEECGK